jgi:hypothetical protein
MNVKGLIVSSGKEYKTYDCTVSVPSLKIHIEANNISEIIKIMGESKYTNIMFMIGDNPIEVALYKKEDNFYANAKEIANLNLDRMPILKENTLVKKILNKCVDNLVTKIKNKK